MALSVRSKRKALAPCEAEEITKSMHYVALLFYYVVVLHVKAWECYNCLVHRKERQMFLKVVVCMGGYLPFNAGELTGEQFLRNHDVDMKNAKV